MDRGTGRGRGLAGLLQAMKKSQMMDSPPSTEDPTPEATPGPSVAPSVVSSMTSTATSIGGRGKIAQMLLAKQGLQGARPGGTAPASDVAPSAPLTAPPVQRSMGRGIKLLQNLSKASSLASKPGEDGDKSPVQSAVQEVTRQMAASTIGSTTTATSTQVAKNKHFREVKDTPPVVMKGTSGRPCHVTSNFVYLQFEENSVFEYEVKYEPDQDYKNMRFKLLNEHRHYFETKTFDGTTLYVPHRLPDEACSLVSTNPNDNSKVHISIIFRRTRRLSEMVHLYNVLFKQIMKDLELVRFGRQHFNEHAAIQIPQHKLEVWPGYVTAVDEYEGGLMLTLDSTSRVLRTQSVLSLIKDAAQTAGNNWKRVVSDALTGCSVMTTYNKKLFR
ncbi:piwi-like protein Ago3 [Phthorimaea operculella]|nr:piwi-like protein Ago3 [Phthorimaea operculella]